ncbi:MAG: HigA family addiction module antitoxin [Tepidisphaeraceae bacterium]|jgi:HTH-type transcriptional regulator/antitoxin HigA
MTPKHRKPAEVFPPGEYLREELEARGWTQSQFAKIIGRPLQTVNGIINGKVAVTAQTAKEIAAAFETSADLWMNLQGSYELFIAPDADPAIHKRAEQVA